MEWVPLLTSGIVEEETRALLLDSLLLLVRMLSAASVGKLLPILTAPLLDSMEYDPVYDSEDEDEAEEAHGGAGTLNGAADEVDDEEVDEAMLKADKAITLSELPLLPASADEDAENGDIELEFDEDEEADEGGAEAAELSWRIRRSAVAVFGTLIEYEYLGLEQIYSTVFPVILRRLKNEHTSKTLLALAKLITKVVSLTEEYSTNVTSN